MTCHAFASKWTARDPVTDDLIQEVADCVNGNRMFNEAMGSKGFTPDAFAVFNDTDRLILDVGRALDAWKGKGDFVAFVSIKRTGESQWLADLMARVFPLIDLP